MTKIFLDPGKYSTDQYQALLGFFDALDKILHKFEFDNPFITRMAVCLGRARITGKPVDMTQLTLSMHTTRKTAGALVARAESAGWIRRETDPDDRRRILVHLTETGRNSILAVADLVLAAFERHGRIFLRA